MAGSGKTSRKVLAALALAASAMATGAQAAPIIGLFNTGTGAGNIALAGGNGVVDSHYKIVETGAQAKTYFTGPYVANDADSRWISVDGQGSALSGNTATYRLTFDLTGLDFTSAAITGSAAGDDAGVIVLNGVNTGLTFNSYTSLTSFSLASGFVAGINYLDFVVTDLFGPPTALRVDNLSGTANTVQTGVPEPSTWAMLMAGFAMLGAMLRAPVRRRGRNLKSA